MFPARDGGGYPRRTLRVTSQIAGQFQDAGTQTGFAMIDMCNETKRSHIFQGQVFQYVQLVLNATGDPWCSRTIPLVRCPTTRTCSAIVGVVVVRASQYLLSLFAVPRFRGESPSGEQGGYVGKSSLPPPFGRRPTRFVLRMVPKSPGRGRRSAHSRSRP